MGLRDRLAAELKAAMKARDAARTTTLRLILAAIHDRDIAARSIPDSNTRMAEDEIPGLLARMVKQRQESVRLYEEGGRLELADKERTEIAVINEFLPRPLSADEMAAAITAAIDATGARTIRDMGRVMALLKERHAGQLDFAVVGMHVRNHLTQSGS